MFSILVNLRYFGNNLSVANTKSLELQNFLICLEINVAACAMSFAFHYSEFVDGKRHLNQIFRNFAKVICIYIYIYYR